MYTLIYFKRGVWHETLLRGTHAEMLVERDAELRAGRHAMVVKPENLRHGMPEGAHPPGYVTDSAPCFQCQVNA